MKKRGLTQRGPTLRLGEKQGSDHEHMSKALLPIAIVAAIARNSAIGKDNGVPWRAPSDLKRFREITWGRPVIMGRKTYQSIGKPLPGRETIVVTHDLAFSEEQVHVAHDFEQALALADTLGRSMHATEIIIAGGAELYSQGIPRAKFLRLTYVDCTPKAADTFFPDVDWDHWRELRRQAPARGPKDEFALEYVDFDRV
jgi:dihydrofolate reductase